MMSSTFGMAGEFQVAAVVHKAHCRARCDRPEGQTPPGGGAA